MKKNIVCMVLFFRGVLKYKIILLKLLFEKKKGILSSFLVYTQCPEQYSRTETTRKYNQKSSYVVAFETGIAFHTLYITQTDSKLTIVVLLVRCHCGLESIPQ